MLVAEHQFGWFGNGMRLSATLPLLIFSKTRYLIIQAINLRLLLLVDLIALGVILGLITLIR